MGFLVRLEEANGNVLAQVVDPKELLDRILPKHEDTTSRLLRYLDEYSDTAFNRLQMHDFLTEWRSLYALTDSGEAHQLLRDIEQMAKRCENEPQLFLKFYGD